MKLEEVWLDDHAKQGAVDEGATCVNDLLQVEREHLLLSFVLCT